MAKRKRMPSIDERIVDKIQSLKNCNRKQAWENYSMRMELKTVRQWDTT
jgi:hypothetical protein